MADATIELILSLERQINEIEDELFANDDDEDDGEGSDADSDAE